MRSKTCGQNETPVQLQARQIRSVTKGSLCGLTEVLDSVPAGQVLGGLYMPSMRLTVKLAFSGGEEVTSYAETPAIAAKLPTEGFAPYVFAEGSAPEQPILVSSSDFVKVG